VNLQVSSLRWPGGRSICQKPSMDVSVCSNPTCHHETHVRSRQKVRVAGLACSGQQSGTPLALPDRPEWRPVSRARTTSKAGSVGPGGCADRFTLLRTGFCCPRGCPPGAVDQRPRSALRAVAGSSPKLHRLRRMNPQLSWGFIVSGCGCSGYVRVRGIGTPMSSKASRWPGVGSASMGTVA
jgi:hypothetical protein